MEQNKSDNNSGLSCDPNKEWLPSIEENKSENIIPGMLYK